VNLLGEAWGCTGLCGYRASAFEARQAALQRTGSPLTSAPPGPRGTSPEPEKHMGGKTMPGWGGASAHGGDAATDEATEATQATDAAHAATSEEQSAQTGQETTTPTAEEPTAPISD